MPGSRPGGGNQPRTAGASATHHHVAWAIVALCCLHGPANAAPSQPYYLRNHSPLLQVFGLPAPEGGVLTAAGTLSSRFAFSLANHADSGDIRNESVILDGESYYADLVLRYGWSERWEVGLDLPYVAHHNGKLDNLIEDWHDVFGLPNTDRRRPSNELELEYLRSGISAFRITRAGGGLGDVRLSGAYRLATSTDAERNLALRGLVKLPTGDADRLRGSGAVDVALSLDATDRATLASRSVALFAQAGVLWLGDTDLLSGQQQRQVPFGSLGVAWHWRPAVELRLQLGTQAEYFDSRLDEIGSGTATVAVGGVFRLARLGVELDIALIEDLISDATPDFGAYVSVRPIARSAGR